MGGGDCGKMGADQFQGDRDEAPGTSPRLADGASDGMIKSVTEVQKLPDLLARQLGP